MFTSHTDVLEIDLTDRSHYASGFPHELFAELRRHGRVLRHGPIPQHGFDREFWTLLGNAEIRRANQEWETFSAAEGHGLVPLPPERRGKMLLSMDPPDHTRMRRLINSGFTPRMVAGLEAKIADRAERILDAAAARVDVDFVADVSFQLPMHVIADIMGIPEQDRSEVFRLTDTMIRALDPSQGMSVQDRQSAEMEIFTYATGLSAEKRANPTDDVWSILANGTLEPFELDLFFTVLAIAGSETTSNALSQGILAFVNNPDQLDQLRRDPSLQRSATEEMLRWSSPVVSFGRTVTRDTELGGQRLLAGDRVVMFHPSGSFDEAVYHEPTRFDIHRSPNPHLAFGGGGAHFCLGASLARTEINVLVSAILRRFATIEVTGEPTWLNVGPLNNVGVAMQSLPLRFT
ncbi:cytochrome P450 [Nocardia bovistercoris]|uniref:Cytochrome P450 n=1 Tax=Nocardia bovistercoris TaxID=2785916 RepID=A0A931I783_9NOCA|nr:cytochrome P450 [Nocardia bovistercoris]MBH0775526.1 cytochrome P450 [Nocardia bovistercoris]